MPYALIFFSLLLAFAPFPASAAEPIIGQASVIDGNTIEIDGQRVGLYGIDAPEGDQACFVDGRQVRCGEQAALALSGRIGQQAVTCEPRDRDQYGQVVAVCSAGGEDLNGWMVGQGLALAYRRFSTDYVRQERKAAKGKAGIWRGYFVKPWDWRRGKRMTVHHSPDNPDCTIKGNITQTGRRVYHVPGGQYYGPAIIEPSEGERWFCSEDEARAAGWRKSVR